jgi:2-oxoglutarate ferredoxin oxidoreductase subunit alpha
MVDFSWMVGGKQGSGIDSTLGLFSRIMMKRGYYVYGYREYFSNIKGMHSFFTVRVSDKNVHSLGSFVDLAIFPDNESVFGERNARGEVVHEGHLKDIKVGGVLLVDSKTDISKITRKDIKIFQIDFDSIINDSAKELNEKTSDVMIAKNMACVAVSVHIMGLPIEDIKAVLREIFGDKSENIIKMNLLVADKAINYTDSKKIPFLINLKQLPKKDFLYMEGFTATAIGKAIAGCKMQTYYPITPASDESSFIEAHSELGIRVVQPESELAVIGMTTGASLAGVRSSLSTSGPGLALMTETVTWAGMTETPLVLVDHQRGAPATGQPTRTEQADLLFTVHMGHGDYGRIVLAPGSVEECISVTASAFNYAERYQLPVIVLGEKSLSQASISMDKALVSKIKNDYTIDRGKLIKNGGENYKRYEFTADHISNRIALGDDTAIAWTSGDEHDEWGHVSEDVTNRNKMMEKRTQKKDLILSTIPKEEKYRLLGDPTKADLLVVGWGGPSNAVMEALKPNMTFLQIKLIEPLPKEVSEIIKSAKKVVCVEQNIGGQLREHIASKTGIIIPNQILKYNGRPMRYDEIRDGLDRVMKGEIKVVLNAC